MGATAAEMTRAQQLGYNGYLEYQLNYQWIDDSAVEAQIATKYPLMSQTSDQLFSADAGQVFQQRSNRPFTARRSRSGSCISAWSSSGRPLQPGLGQSPIFASLPTIAT